MQKYFIVSGTHTLKLIANPEEMIDSCFAGKDNCREISQSDLLCTEIFCRDSFNMNEGFEIDLQIMFAGELEIG